VTILLGEVCGLCVSMAFHTAQPIACEARMRMLPRIALLSLVALVAVSSGLAGAQPTTPPAFRLFLPLVARPEALVLVSDRDSGATIVELSPTGSDPRTLSGPRTNDSEPFPSPDGRLIAFFTTRDARNELYLMNRDGTGQRKLADCVQCSDVEWAPDGRQLILETIENREVPLSPAVVWANYLVRLDGSPPVQLPDSSVVAPDFGSVAFVSRANPGYRLQVQPLAGGEPITLASGLASFGDLRWSPDSSRLAFVEFPFGGPRQVWLVRRDGQGLRRLGLGAAPAWSPDGSRLAFNGRADEVFVVNADGDQQRQLGVGDDLHWSPDGSELAFVTPDNTPAPNALMVASAEGGAPTTLAQGVGRLLGWTPDGAQLAYLSGGSDASLLLVGRGGGAPTRLAPSWFIDTLRWSPSGTAALALAGEESYIVWRDGSGARQLAAVDPRWTRDGRILASGSVTVPPRILSRVDGRAELVPLAIGAQLALAPDGRSVAYLRDKRLFVSPTDRAEERALAPGLRVVGRAAWSPDGRSLAVAGQRDATSAIFVVGADDGVARQLVECSNIQRCAPFWSPDGATLFFTDGGTLFAVPAGGGVAPAVGAAAEPQLSPDGRQIAYLGPSPGDLYVMNADGSGARLLARCSELDPLGPTCSRPRWSPDGARIAVQTERVSKGVFFSVVVVAASDGAQLEKGGGRDASWTRRGGLVRRIEEQFGRVDAFFSGLYPTYDAYQKLCLARPCRPFPAGHGNVLEYAVAP
jgi:Tol biopolymer transport system component